MEPARNVVMTSTDHFEITYVINPHMAGNIGDVNTQIAKKQWQELHDAFVSLGFNVDVVYGMPGQPDMVFCANQTLPFLQKNGQRGAVLSKMYAPQRAGEVLHYERYFEEQGWDIIDDIFKGDIEFEGMGDALWHVGKRLLWGGHGFRTDISVYDLISRRLETPVLALVLDDPEFYHLDTCLCILDSETALIYPDAFKKEGLELIHHFFPRVIEAPKNEARELFACNAHCPDGKNVIIQRGCEVTNGLLRDLEFNVVEVDTDEFLKSGGSVFCMKLMTW